MKTIVAYKLQAIWSDGEKEGLAVCLPEYLHQHLTVYFKELEELREESDKGFRDEPYNFEPNSARRT